MDYYSYYLKYYYYWLYSIYMPPTMTSWLMSIAKKVTEHRLVYHI